jgi:hypothetical protein
VDAPERRKRMTRAEVAVPGALALLASMPSVPAMLLGRRNDVLAWNGLGHALVGRGTSGVHGSG